MANYVISEDIGITNRQEIVRLINDLNAGIDTDITISHNQGGNALLAVDLSSAILNSSAKTINVTAEAFVASAAAFVIISLLLYRNTNVTLIFNKPVAVMYHRPRIDNADTGLSYFDVNSSVCTEYDKIMFALKNTYNVSYNDLKAYYSNHEFFTVLS